MANDALYGTDVQAMDDLPDPEVLCSGDVNVAYALTRRLFNDPEAMEEIGITSEYDAINLNDWIGGTYNLNDRTVLDDLQQQATQAIYKDPRVDTITVTATYVAGVLSVSVAGDGSDGPFSFVVSVSSDGVTAPFLGIEP